MSARFNIQTVQPEAYKAMFSFSGFISTTKLSKTQIGLIEIRASQINGCAFCINMHTTDALKNGETNQRIFLLNAWKETDLFTAEEKALLAITEEVTLISHKGLTEATYARAKEFFSEEVIAQIIMTVVIINGWNRICISTHTPVPAS
jgi:AhpD family alkylhydroperoxidase